MAKAILNKSGVRTEHPEYVMRSPQWKRCRDAMEGQDAIHAAGTAYLPKLTEQSQASYNAYKQRTPWFNASWRTTQGLVGMMFRKPPKQEFPKAIQPHLENINLEGDSFDQFTKDVAYDVLEVGRIGLLVDYPPAPVLAEGQSLTVAQAEAIGHRPVIKSYDAECIINWKHRNIKNATVLSMVVLVEVVPKPTNDEFSQETEKQYRVLDLDEANQYRQRLFKIDEKGNDVQIGADIYPTMNGDKMSFIPFVFIGPDGNKAIAEAPPQIDLVDLNIKHYQVSADYFHGCHFSGLPTFFVAGFNPTTNKRGETEKIYLGSETAIVIQDPNGKAGYAEVQGDFGALRTNLDAIKQEMATLGARMLADSSEKQVETFGATAIKHVGENSILASIAISISTGLKIALGWFCEWAGQKSEIVYELNRDYLPVQIDAATLTSIIAAWQSGALSEGEMFDLLKRGDIVEATKTLEDHQAEIDAAPPPAPPSNTKPGELGTEDQDTKDQRQIDLNKAAGGNNS